MARTKGLAFRVMNPLALKVPEVNALFKKVFSQRALAGKWDDEIEFDVVRLLQDPRAGVFMGQENNQFKALLIVTLPANKLLPSPVVYTVWNEGSKALLKQMANEGVAFLKANGYDHFWGVNQLTDDETYARLFSFMGKPSKVASLLEFKLK